MAINPDKVKAFWNWFAVYSNELSKPSDDGSLIKQLDSYLYSMAQGLEWEMGPVDPETILDAEARSYLAISPCLNEELVSAAREIIALAPECKGWIFYSFKPAKGWTGNWNMLNELDSVISIDANEWKYSLYQFDDNTFDMDIWVNNIDGNLSTRQIAVDIAITNLLGEERHMKEIKHVSIIEGDFNSQDNWTLLRNLEKHLNSLL